jgi:hypothetical protein
MSIESMSALLPESMHYASLDTPEHMHHHWTHNRTRDSGEADDTLFSMLLVSMTAVTTMLVLFWCIIQVYFWNDQRHRRTPSTVVTMIGSTDKLHQEKPSAVYTATYA